MNDVAKVLPLASQRFRTDMHETHSSQCFDWPTFKSRSWLFWKNLDFLTFPTKSWLFLRLSNFLGLLVFLLPNCYQHAVISLVERSQHAIWVQVNTIEQCSRLLAVTRDTPWRHLGPLNCSVIEGHRVSLRSKHYVGLCSGGLWLEVLFAVSHCSHRVYLSKIRPDIEMINKKHQEQVSHWELQFCHKDARTVNFRETS